MDLTVKLKLLTTKEQWKMLHSAMVVVNAACNHISQRVFDEKVFRRFDIIKLAYTDVRRIYGLVPDMAKLAAEKVSRAYKTQRHCISRFRPYGSILLDRRALSYRYGNFLLLKVSDEWVRLEYEAPPDSEFSSGKEAHLVLRDGVFYVHQAIDYEPRAERAAKEFLGVDLGIKNIAYDSQGERFSGAHINNFRRRNKKIKKRLRAKGTKSAKRLLKKRGIRETRFATDVDHCISKKLVAKVKDTSLGIAIEDLKGIRKRRVGLDKTLLRGISTWSFYRLRTFITYKCEMFGVPLAVVAPAHTSTDCPSCGCRDKKNRASRDWFKCIRCGHSGYADHIAAINIAAKARDANGRATGP